MNTADRSFRTTRYYVELTRKAQKEGGEIKFNSWIGDEYILILEIALEDYSHLPPTKQMQIKKVNGTLVNIKMKQESKRNGSKSKLPPETIQESKCEESKKIFSDKKFSGKDTQQNTQKVIQRLSKFKEKLDLKQESKPEESASRLQINVKSTEMRHSTPSKVRKKDEKEVKKEIWKI